MLNETYFYNLEDAKTLIKKHIYNGQKANVENTINNIHFLTDCITICRPEYIAIFRDELKLQNEILFDLISDLQ
jgi:hypothetical protein